MYQNIICQLNLLMTVKTSFVMGANISSVEFYLEVFLLKFHIFFRNYTKFCPRLLISSKFNAIKDFLHQILQTLNKTDIDFRLFFQIFQ